jgi:hypothetical protein
MARLLAVEMLSGINIPTVYLTWSPELALVGQLFFLSSQTIAPTMVWNFIHDRRTYCTSYIGPPAFETRLKNYDIRLVLMI